MKLRANELKAAAEKVLSQGNPYISCSIEFFIDKIPHFIYTEKIHTKEELDMAYLKTAKHDILAGFNDRSVGYYDKWYRYSRADEGAAYDAGVRLAVEKDNCPEEFYIIEVASHSA